MQLFEITLVLLTLAVVFMHIARRLRVPYPSLLALAGRLRGASCRLRRTWASSRSLPSPCSSRLRLWTRAFDMPPREMVRIWVPLVSLAVVLVLLTTAAVAWAGVALGGLPVAAAIALGAIVAPPDAAAAAAVLREFNLPRRTVAVLQGESLLNDAVALLVFGLAVSAAVSPGQCMGTP